MTAHPEVETGRSPLAAARRKLLDRPNDTAPVTLCCKGPARYAVHWIEVSEAAETRHSLPVKLSVPSGYIVADPKVPEAVIAVLEESDVQFAVRTESNCRRLVACKPQTGGNWTQSCKRAEISERTLKLHHPHAGPADLTRLPFRVIVGRDIGASTTILHYLAYGAPGDARRFPAYRPLGVRIEHHLAGVDRIDIIQIHRNVMPKALRLVSTRTLAPIITMPAGVCGAKLFPAGILDAATGSAAT